LRIPATHPERHRNLSSSTTTANTEKENEMSAIRHRVGITAPAATVYEAIATQAGLTQWWTRDVRGQSSLGSELEFYFRRPEPGAVMQVVDLEPGRLVAWKCVQGPEEWVDTEIRFELSDDGSGETVLLFKHADWSDTGAFMHHCSTKWGYYLIGLKRGLEGGTATPCPDDERIGNWD
jgi:uncharacterized protein YndB with AHSA1/START domain